MVNKPTTGPIGMIVFPAWVKGPTPCKTRTYSLVLPADERNRFAIHLTRTVPNRPKGK